MINMEKSKFDLGMETMTRIMGEHGKFAFESVNKLSPEIAQLCVSYGFGELYASDVLTDRERVIITVTSLITQGAFDQLSLHAHTAMNVGITKEEITQMILQLIGYVGFPKTLAALQVVTNVYEENSAK